MAINQEQRNVGMTAAERRDNSDGWDRGYNSPYPRDKEEIILANIAKVSPAFVAGYKEGTWDSRREEPRAQWEQDAMDLDEFFRDSSN